jgi:glycosyltransferase involved in cell wall biosynthesis
MRIAFLTGMPTNPTKPGGYVHVTQVANNLQALGHTLYTNLRQESDKFIRLTEDEFFRRGREIQAFYIRLHGSPGNDELTRFRSANPDAPCIWEVNAPLEELSTRGVPGKEILRSNERRQELAQMVDAAVCVSLEMEEYAKDFLRIPRTYVVQNGTDPETFTPAKREKAFYGENAFTALWSGSPEYAWQGLEIAQKLAEKLKSVDRSVRIAVTAEGTSTENLLYLGTIPYSEMPRYMASADVGLCVYKEIDFFGKFFFSPLKLYDYMASGLPIIGSNVGQIRSVLEEYGSGELTDTTAEDIIEKIVKIKNNTALAYEMGNRGREAVVDRHNWRNVTLRLEEIILSLIGERTAPNFEPYPNGASDSGGRIARPEAPALNPTRRVGKGAVIHECSSRAITERVRRIVRRRRGQ